MYKKVHPPYSPMRGSALLSALFIMTLVTLVVTAMSVRLQLDIYRTQSLLTNDKLYFSSQYVLFWGISMLEKPEKLNTTNESGLIATLPNNIQMSYDNIKITGALYDLQAKFNINNLRDPNFYPGFISLLNHVGDKSTKTVRTIVKSIAFWLRPFKIEYHDDPNLAWYLKQKPPYYPANQMFNSISELHLIHGMDKELYDKLTPFIMTVPDIARLNIYSAPEILIKTLKPDLKESQIKSLLKERAKKRRDTYKMNSMVTKFGIPPGLICYESKYFLTIATIISHEFTIKVYNVLRKDIDTNGHTSVFIIKQSINLA